MLNVIKEDSASNCKQQLLKIYRIVDNIELLQGDCYRNILKYGYKRNKPLP